MRGWMAYRRAMIPLIFGATCIGLALVIPSQILLFCALLWLVAIPLAAAIVLFNWPKILVPPASRNKRV
jgi:uncharacterized protein (DUF58 family)